MLLATHFLAVGQSGAPHLSSPRPEAHALRLLANGQFAEARQVVTRLIEDAERTDSLPAYQAALWRLLGVAENSLGRYEDAEAALIRGVQLCDQSEPAAPELAVALLIELADAYLNQKHPDDADRALRRAIGIASSNLPAGHPQFASIQRSLGVLFCAQGQLSRAEKAFRLALTILEQNMGQDHPDVLATVGALAGLLTMTGRQTEAMALLERNKTVLERLYGPAHPDTIYTTFTLGVAMLTSAPDRAESMLRQVIANWRLSQPERHPLMIKFLRALATSLWVQRDYHEAGVLSEQALQMSRDIFGLEHPHTIARMYEHVQLLKSIRRGKEAAALKKEADRIRAVRGYSEPDRLRIDILSLTHAQTGGRHSTLSNSALKERK